LLNLVQNKTEVPPLIDHDHQASGSFSPLVQFVAEPITEPLLNLVQNKTEVPPLIDHDHQASDSFSPLVQFFAEPLVKPMVNLVQNKTEVPPLIDHDHKASGSFSPLVQFCVSFVLSLWCFYLLLLVYRIKYGCSRVSNPPNVSQSEQKSKRVSLN
jgi:hypothetical protein